MEILGEMATDLKVVATRGGDRQDRAKHLFLNYRHFSIIGLFKKLSCKQHFDV